MKRLSCSAVLLLIAAVPGFASSTQHSVTSDHQFHFPANVRSSKAFPQNAAPRMFNLSQNSHLSQPRQTNQAHSKPHYRGTIGGANPPTGKPTFVSSTQIPVGGYMGYNNGEPAVSGDFNGDGKLDAATVVETDTGYAFSVVLGNGDGTFQTPVLTTITDSCAVLAVGDLNGDKKDDILVVHSANNQCSNASSSFDVFISNGDGTFTQGNNYTISSNQLGGGLLHDVNGDGFLDVVVVDQANPGNVWTVLGNGDGTFSTTPTSVALSGQVNQSVLADLNGDGVLDVAALVNNQVTVFLAATPTASSYATGVPLITSDTNYNATGIAVGDLNGDGFPEIVTANASCNDSGPNPLCNNVTVFVNNQSGGFATGVYYQAAAVGTSDTPASVWPTAVAIADVNGDGKPDVLSANSGINDVTVLLGNGDGTLNTPSLGYSIGGLPSPCCGTLTSAIVADFNGDGFPDILIADGDFSLEFAKGYGDGTFRAAPDYYSPTGTDIYANAYAIASGDFNGDGIPDIVIGQYSDSAVGTLTVFLSNPGGSMQPGVSYGSGGEFPSVTVADFNKDGKLDIAGSDWADGWVQIFTGNGDGTFTAGATISTSATSGGPNDLVAADFNGDGYPDLAVINYGSGSVAVLINDGTGNFLSAVTYPLSSDAFFGIAAGDVNGDGKIDLAIPLQGSSTVAILLGNGDGTFQQESPTTDVSLGTYSGVFSLALGDLNGDGILDMAVTLEDGGGSDVAILLGAGSGVFNAPTVLASSLLDYTLSSPEPEMIKAVDIDGDGNLDLVYSNHENGTVGILYGKGSGAFYDPVEYPVSSPFGLVVADVNNDGAPDIVTSDNSLTGLSVLLNASGSGTMGNYTITPSATSATVTAGSSATYTLTITPTNHYNGTITFSCGTLPALTSCTFNPPSVTLNGNTPVTVTVTISTTAVSASLRSVQHTSPILLASLSGMGLFGMVLAGSLKQRSWLSVLTGIFILIMMFSLAGCGGSSSGNPGGNTNPTQAVTTTTLSSSQSTIMVGGSVTFTGKVAASTGSPTGNVTFLDGTTTLGTGTLSGGTASFSTSKLAAGVHKITASYGGDANFTASTSSLLTQTVDNPGTKAGGYTVTITATGTTGTNNGSTAAHPINLSLTVQ